MATRSGARFRARNRPFYTSYAELLRHHQRLTTENPAVTQQLAVISGVGNLIQTTVRFPVTSRVIRANLVDIFRDLLDQLNGAREHYEVVLTFNAVLFSPTDNTWSVFYGHDFRGANTAGRARELTLAQVSLACMHR